MKRIYIKFCIIQTKRIQHNIINRITFIKIIHPRKPAISLSYPYRFNNLLTPSSPTLFKTILSQTSPQIFPSNWFYAIARSKVTSQVKIFFTIRFLIILVRHRIFAKRRRIARSLFLSPLLLPPHVSRPVGFSSKRRSGKTNRWHRLSRHALWNFRDFLVPLPPPPIIKACSLARPTVQTLNTGCSLNIRGRESVADGIWEEGRKKRVEGNGERGWQKLRARIFGLVLELRVVFAETMEQKWVRGVREDWWFLKSWR